MDQLNKTWFITDLLLLTGGATMNTVIYSFGLTRSTVLRRAAKFLWLFSPSNTQHNYLKVEKAEGSSVTQKSSGVMFLLVKSRWRMEAGDKGLPYKE